MAALETLEPQDPRQAGRYRIVARLGSGGMGQVYLARSPAGRLVAVKVVRPELARDAEFRRRFAREVTAARRVSGAFTAGVVDADPDGSPAWLAVVYVPGVSLGEAISAHGPWPVRPVLALGAGLAEALEAIHAAGVVHRDLKPSNVLLAADGPRVIDFGISLAGEDSALTHTGMTIGTPGFMSPEQLTGRAVGPASDVFALGALLAYTATGVGPFGSGTPHALHFRAVYEQPSLDTLSPELRPVVAACLAKEPDERPTVAALLDRLTTMGGCGKGEETADVTVLLTEPGWMPDRIARLVREHTDASLPHTPPPVVPDKPSAPPNTPAPAPPPALHHAPTETGAPSSPVLASPADAELLDPPTPRPERHRRRIPPLMAALGVALAVSAIAVLAVFLGETGSKGQGDDPSEDTGLSHSKYSPSTAESPEVGAARFARAPEACKALTTGELEQLLPGVTDTNGEAGSSNTADHTTCYWSGKDSTDHFRFLSVAVWRHDSDTRSGQQHAEDTYTDAVSDVRTSTDAWNIRTEPVSGIGDQVTAISSDSKTNNHNYKDATVVVRTGNVVVRVYDSGTGFADALPPDSASTMRDATSAAKDVIEAVAAANR
ncbi:serine/threonine-protein kinase [Streptomyces sp. TLI_146]|uniref:serine/threonine-protein kinase n=1 Tax=Streptomyces sp. TLI_146 TaxID=1938858 RepID=UPI00214B6B74|nr:serine/threonine-protein kinase [Streptomyces sp. TLI_146]